MDTIKERLERDFAIIDRLDRRRRETQSPKWGHEIEYLIIRRALQQLEADSERG